ncbi:MAG TPA: hypothetical protein DDZ39_06105 [Flavobacteriaceae bacterium]|jgi:REP element-mobilizing transposase RayT|nr:hypothetical protein [Flavobacteriaceae bacterium]
MSNKFKNKYRIKSARLQNWDYGSNGMYFITICTQNREHFFGEIIDGKMQLTEIGKMAEKYWHEIPEHFPFVKLGKFVVMPNHMHGIIIIDKMDDAPAMVETQNFASLRTTASSKNKFGPQSKNLASIVRGYKIGVTKNARKINANFGWQSRFHDHIIRNNKSFNNISNYIINNPKKWDEDKFYNKN